MRMSARQLRGNILIQGSSKHAVHNLNTATNSKDALIKFNCFRNKQNFVGIKVVVGQLRLRKCFFMVECRINIVAARNEYRVNGFKVCIYHSSIICYW